MFIEHLSQLVPMLIYGYVIEKIYIKKCRNLSI